MSEFSELPCPTCGSVANEFHIPVWQDVREWDDGQPPDYIGCTECETMVPYGDWLDNGMGADP